MTYQTIAMDVQTLAHSCLLERSNYDARYNAVRKDFLIRFVQGTQTRVNVREGETKLVEHTSHEPHVVHGFGGYCTLRDAFIGWLGDQGWRSVLHWWGVFPEHQRIEMYAPTTVVKKYITNVTEEKYVNVMPVPKDFQSSQMRFAYHNARKAGKLRDFHEAIDDYSELTWLTSTPPTRSEVEEAVNGMYRDYNYAMYMEKYSQW